ncbi:MAG: hypothetical protein IJN25_09725, partial [Clostridia bacterium]|nr:hypothetical protein [Clostridia bacterium]
MKTPNVFVGEGRARERSCRFSSRNEVRAEFAKLFPRSLARGKPDENAKRFRRRRKSKGAKQ